MDSMGSACAYGFSLRRAALCQLIRGAVWLFLCLGCIFIFPKQKKPSRALFWVTGRKPVLIVAQSRETQQGSRMQCY